MKSWTAQEEEEGCRLANGGMTAAEVYLSLAMSRCNKYESALSSIAKQRTVDEYKAEEDFDGDWENGYDTIIDLARKALK